MKKQKWFLDFDYGADPERTAIVVRERLYDQLDAVQATFDMKGNRLVFSKLDDAVQFRLKFDRNVVNSGRVVAA